MAAMTPEMMQQMIAQMQAQIAAQAQTAAQFPAATPAVPPPPVTMQPPPGYAPQAPPPGYAPAGMMPAPQGAQPPIVPQGSAGDDDFIGELPPADLPPGTYDAEVQYVETKSGVSDKGTAWENLRYRFTVLAGPLVGQSVVDSFSTKFTRALYTLAEACGRPIVRDAAGRVAFRKSGLNGCKVTFDLVIGKDDYSRVVKVRPLGTK